MKVGDPKKAFVLAVVALVIVSVAAFQLFPKAKKVVVSNATNSATESGLAEAKGVANLPTTLTSDPFKHRETGAAEVPSRPLDQSATSGSNTTRVVTSGSGSVAPMPVPLSGNLGSVPTGITGLPPTSSGAKPAENTGINQPKEQGKPKTATLQAILHVKRRIACIAISGRETSLQLEAGSKIGEYTITEISDSQITLTKRGKELKLEVGESQPL